ncbi:MAG: hypothetical protein ACLGIN_00590 [Candidatus Sericytochromatia bacterium]
MFRPFMGLAAAAAVFAPMAPAVAETPTMFDQRAGIEYQSWNWGQTQYVTPMRVFTVTDHTGALFGAMMNVAENEGRRVSAERSAILKGERTYTYQVSEARAREGTRFGFTVGTGDVASSNVTATAGPASAIMASVTLAGDMFPAFGGVFTMNTALSYWMTRGLPSGSTNLPNEHTAWDWPIGITYRYAVPFLPSLVIEPGASFNWLRTVGLGIDGDWNFDCRVVGVEAGYYVHPKLKVRAGYHLGRYANNDRKGPTLADMTNLSAGLTAMF